MSIQGVFYDRHAAYMQGVDVGQSGIDVGLSGSCSMHAACMAIVNYA